MLLERPFIRRVRPLGGITGDAWLVELEGNQLAVFKSYEKRGTAADFNINRERAAYVVDHFLGFNRVPTTVIREIEGVKGSLQSFIADAKPNFELEHPVIGGDEIITMDVFDSLILKLDRNSQNFLFSEDTGKVVLIDHGETFMVNIATDPWLEPNIKTHVIPEGVRGSLQKFIGWHEGQRLLNGHLAELLGEETADAYLKRFAAFIGAIGKDGKVSLQQFAEGLKAITIKEG